MGSDGARHERALDVYRTIRGEPDLDLEQTARGMTMAVGPLGTFGIDHVLGDIWSRPQLDRRDQSFVSVTALTCLGAERELRTQIGGALDHGASADEIEELILHFSAYAGYPRGFDGMRVALMLFAEREDVETPRQRSDTAELSDDERHAAELEVHAPGALRNGLSREQIHEVILQLTLYAGYRAAVEAIRTIRRIPPDAGRSRDRRNDRLIESRRI